MLEITISLSLFLCLPDSFVALNGKEVLSHIICCLYSSVLEESSFTNLLTIFILFKCIFLIYFFIDISTASPDHEMSYNTVYGQFMEIFKNSPQILVLAGSHSQIEIIIFVLLHWAWFTNHIPTLFFLIYNYSFLDLPSKLTGAKTVSDQF